MSVDDSVLVVETTLEIYYILQLWREALTSKSFKLHRAGYVKFKFSYKTKKAMN